MTDERDKEDLREKQAAAIDLIKLAADFCEVEVLLPEELYLELDARAEELGRTAEELASLYLWQAIRGGS